MSAHVLPAVDGREVVRCDECHLVQFKNERAGCVRCHVPFVSDDDDSEDEQVESAVPPSGVELGGGQPAEKESALSQSFAANFRLQRYRAGLSQRELALKMGCPRTYISKVEQGKCLPTLDSLERLSHALEVNPAMLIDPDHVAVEMTIADPLFREVVLSLRRINKRNREYLVNAMRQLARTNARVHASGTCQPTAN